MKGRRRKKKHTIFTSSLYLLALVVQPTPAVDRGFPRYQRKWEGKGREERDLRPSSPDPGSAASSDAAAAVYVHKARKGRGNKMEGEIERRREGGKKEGLIYIH